MTSASTNRRSRVHGEFFRYLLVGVDAMVVDYRLSKLVAVAVVFFWNCLARRLTLFTVRTEPA